MNPRRLLVFALSLAGCAAEVNPAQDLYLATRYEESLRLLRSMPQEDPAVLELTGKNQFMLGNFKKAAEAFEALTGVTPRSAKAHLWLGRAHGRMAETANPFRAPGLAVKARKSFEKAIELDPKNIEAIDDLLEYYLRAPRFLGGGSDKAAALTERLKDVDPAEYYSAQSRLAQSEKEPAAAENLLRRAVELAPKQINRLLDLARFLARQGKIGESDDAFRKAESLAPGDPDLLFTRASILIETKREQERARQLLQQYLASPLTPAHPPRAEAERLLRMISGG